MAKIEINSFDLCSSNELRSAYINLLLTLFATVFFLGFWQPNSGANGFVLQELPLYRLALNNYLRQQQFEGVQIKKNQKNSVPTKSSSIAEMNLVSI